MIFMDLNEVAVFIKVVQVGSFSKAAGQLGMPNSTVSAKVSSLEKRLGVTLIQRTTRKLNITPAGLEYFKRCIEGLEQIHKAETEIVSSQMAPQGLLRITAPVEFGGSTLPQIITDYIKKYPQMRVEVLLTDRVVDLLGENVDLAIRGGNLEDSTLIGKKIGESTFGLFASPKYLKSKGSPSHPKELRHHQCIQLTPLGDGEWNLKGPKSTFDASITASLKVNDLTIAKGLAVLGNGIVLLPTDFCLAELRSNKLLRILPDWGSGLTPLHFVYPAQRFVAPKLSAFIAMAAEPLKQDFEKCR